MISVEDAQEIILKHVADFGNERVPFREAKGRILAEDIIADRDLPPFDRVTMDGIALRYSDFAAGKRSFKVAATVAAGANVAKLEEPGTVIEIMTGASMPEGADTIVRYEDISIQDGICTILNEDITEGQDIHFKGMDKRKGGVMIEAGHRVNANILALAAACGYVDLLVKRVPKAAIFSSGDELVAVADVPLPWQIRQSNVYALEAMLKSFGVQADVFSLKDDKALIRENLEKIVNSYDLLVMTGGVSQGKFDFIPSVLDELGIEKFFHKISQKPGKPFWFGKGESIFVFALPGNPVSTTLCMTRYFLPWMRQSMGLKKNAPWRVRLSESISFAKPLTYFVQSSIRIDDDGVCWADPIRDNGSGDFSSLALADGFVELPKEDAVFSSGRLVDFYPFEP